MDSRENPIEDMMVVDAHAPKQCIFSNDREWPTQPTLLVGGLHTFPVEGDLCHLCDSIVKIAFNIEGGPTPIEIMKMRFMCVRAHKHKGTFSFNTAVGHYAFIYLFIYLTFFNVDIYNSFINKITNLNRLNIKMKKEKKKKKKRNNQKKQSKEKITTTMDN